MVPFDKFERRDEVLDVKLHQQPTNRHSSGRGETWRCREPRVIRPRHEAPAAGITVLSYAPEEAWTIRASEQRNDHVALVHWTAQYTCIPTIIDGQSAGPAPSLILSVR